MAYKELVKNFEKIREYMRDFYVYGFRTRSDFSRKSARSYDDERRRVESWLGDAMSFRQDASGKRLFISVDSRTLPHNPLFRAFKAKSFTDKDVVLHFYLLDCLADGQAHTLREIADYVYDAVSSTDLSEEMADDATVRNKLKEYSKIGLIAEEKQGRQMLYRLNAKSGKIGPEKAQRPESAQQTEPSQQTEPGQLAELLPAIVFSSETMPLGVVGSFLLDKVKTVPDFLSFKHHYLFNTFDSEILEALLQCRNAGCRAEICFFTRRSAKEYPAVIYPLKIFVSTQNGRENLLAYNYGIRRPRMYRIDRIRSVKMLDRETDPEALDHAGKSFSEKLWGISGGDDRKRTVDHLEMLIRAGEDEAFIVQRLQREKRCGIVAEVSPGCWKFEADVSDAMEMMPWIRTFIGRIISLKCSDPEVEERFRTDLERMARMYGLA